MNIKKDSQLLNAYFYYWDIMSNLKSRLTPIRDLFAFRLRVFALLNNTTNEVLKEYSPAEKLDKLQSPITEKGGHSWPLQLFSYR